MGNRYTRAVEKRVQDPTAREIFISSILNRYASADLQRIRIESSSACNLRCRYCPTGCDYNNQQVVRQIMPQDVFSKIVEQVKDIPTITTATMYLGGEPLLNKNLLPNIRRLLNETSINYIQLVTNGMLVTEEFCQELCAVENFDRFTIEISIDGKSPEENDYYRRGSNYGKIKNNVIMLRKSLPSDFLIQVTNIQVPALAEVNNTPKVPGYLLDDFSELRTGEFGHFSLAAAWSQVWPGIDEEYLIANGYQKKAILKDDPCIFPMYEASIRANGDVVPCCYDIRSDYILGNICSEKLTDIIDSPQYRKLREGIVTYYAFGDDQLLPQMCRKCVKVTNEILYK